METLICELQSISSTTATKDGYRVLYRDCMRDLAGVLIWDPYVSRSSDRGA